ncbi:guanylate cyclase [Pycnococcus provasolii]
MVHTISGNQLHPHRRRRSTPARAPQWWQSQESVTATWIRFHNTSKSHTVRLFWYDCDGLLRPYKEIAPGRWIMRSADLPHASVDIQGATYAADTSAAANGAAAGWKMRQISGG